MTFRHRLLATSMATLAVGLIALLLTGNVLLDRRVAAEAGALLRARVEAEIASVSVSRGHVVVRETPNDTVLDRSSWVFDGSSVVERPKPVDPALDALAVRMGRTAEVAERDGPGQTRLRIQPLVASGGLKPTGAVVVALSVGTLKTLQKEVAIGSVGMALLILFAGWFAIRVALDGALRPVSEMTAHAESWGAHDLDRRFNLGEPRDELTSLSATLDHLLSRIAASRRHEQHFASEIAHELRTPLAGIRGRAELMRTGRHDRETNDALDSIVRQVDRLEATIGALVAVARGELAGTAGVADVGEILDDLDGVSLTIQPSLPRVEGDADVIRRALAPLIDNARRHAMTAVSVEALARGGCVEIRVTDDGPGLAPGLGEEIFDPGKRGPEATDDGAGLGLALSRRLARACGGDVRIGPGRGGSFVLELSAVGAGASSQ